MTELALEPYQYQIDDMNYIIDLKQCGILHDPGVGKTFGVLMAMTYLIEMENVKPLVVVPPILLQTWYDKIYEYFHTNLKTVIYHGPKRKSINFEKYDIVLTSYNIFQRDYNRFRDSHFNMLVCDESQKLKIGEVKVSPKTGNMNLFGCVQSFKRKVEYLVLMSGTPVTKYPVDAFYIIQLMNPNAYVTKKNFLKHHAVYAPTDSGFRIIVGWKNLETLNKLLGLYTRRLIKSEVLELPKKQLIIKQFSLSDKHRDKLKELWDFGFVEMSNTAEFLDGMALMMRVRQAMMDPSILELKEKSAYFEMLDLLLEDLKGEQVIIYAHFQNTMKLLAEHLKDYDFVELHGQSKKKDEAVSKFKSGEAQILLANPLSAGVGLDFQQCHNVIFFELDYVVDSFWQGIDRTHRPGQEHEVNVFIFVAKDTPAVSLVRGIRENINYLEQVLKGKEDQSIFWKNKITAEEAQSWTI